MGNRKARLNPLRFIKVGLGKVRLMGWPVRSQGAA